MRKRHPNPRLVKIHRNYKVEEIADLFKVHKCTVRAWIKAGLPTTDNMRPMLVLGPDLAEFIQARRNKNKRPCGPGELYCVKCRAPRTPDGMLADYVPVTAKFGNLTGICPECNSMMNRRVSLARIKDVFGNLDISFPKAA